MSNLMPRTAFLEETASLFTDEKIASARLKVIEWLNDLATTTNTKQKCDAITKVQEMIVHGEAELLEEFIDNILSLSHDPLIEVRRSVVAFIEEVCKVKTQQVPRVVPVLALLLRDNSPMVQKRVIQGCASVYRNTLQWICGTDEITESVEQAWNTLCLMKAQILDMIDHDNDGIRTNSIKFLEGIVVLQTYPDEDSMKRKNDFSLEDIPLSLKIARRRKLEDEALNIFELLIKFHAASHISSVNLIACTGALCTIAKLRPSLMSPVVEALKNLCSNLPPTLTDSQVSSVRKHVKMQLLNILRQPAAVDSQTTVIQLLADLGSSNTEIARAIPRLDRSEQQRRTKRALEGVVSVTGQSKRMKGSTEKVLPLLPPSADRPMEVDVEEIAEQTERAKRTNETCVAEALKSVETVVSLVIGAMAHLPAETVPDHFLTTYTPVVNFSVAQQIQRVAQTIAEQLTEVRLGPGASHFTKEPPMRPRVSLEEEKSIIQGVRKEMMDDAGAAEVVLEEDEQIDEAMDDGIQLVPSVSESATTKKLRETLDRFKNAEQSNIPRMKQRAKTLKLQEITKPLPRAIKEQYLGDAVKRILKAEVHARIGGVLHRRLRILPVFASSFIPSVREIILAYIYEDILQRIDLAFAWLFEEYCLLQGFTRHSYIKSEHKPDFAYNRLLLELIGHVIDKIDLDADRPRLLERIYLSAPLLTEEAINKLSDICLLANLSLVAMKLTTELALRRPPRQQRFLEILLQFAVNENVSVREHAIESLLTLYAVHKVLVDEIEQFALKWLRFLETVQPPATFFGTSYGRPTPVDVWNDELAKICLTLFLAVLPYHEELIQNLSEVYTATTPEMKRTVLRAIEVPIRRMGPDSFELLQLIETCPKGAETLVTRVIYILTDKAIPTSDLVTRVRDLYTNRVSDVRMLIPILNGLTKKEVLVALPRLIKLNPVVVKEVFNRLLGIGQDLKGATLPVSPTELLVALHTIDPARVELKFIVKATSLCLSEKEFYTQDVLAIVLQQLVEMAALPTLLMRTVIQSLTLYPRLAPFVINLLHRLILKQVWKHKVVWDGFLKCCQRLQPQSLPVLIQLPTVQLTDALNLCPDLRTPLLEHVKGLTDNQVGQVSQQTMEILVGKDQQIAAVPADAAVSESVESEKTGDSEAGQPLPPGEE